ELLFKSYKCQPPQCTPGALTDVKIFDKVEVGVFYSRGEIFCAPPDGEVFANGIFFGLVNESKGAPFASLGLAPPDSSPDKRLINSSVFSVYLSAGEDPKGELILGGEDRSKYEGPLEYMAVTNPGRQASWISAFVIGFFHRGKKMCLDLASLTPVPTPSEESGLLKVSCADAAHLPPITFLMKGFGGELPLLEIPATSYVYKETEDVRILAITFGFWGCPH
ncbi:hypothetical protein FOZ62_000950, partial [Perkinsus olseni]